jgi:hypothetical protein
MWRFPTCCTHGAAPSRVETGDAEKIPGVLIVKDGETVAVIHERPDVAEAARARIKAQFQRPQHGTDDTTIFEHLLRTAGAAWEWRAPIYLGTYVAMMAEVSVDA